MGPEVPRPPAVVPGFVVDGAVTRIIEIHPYPQAPTALGGCTNFSGRYITDPAEISAIRARVEAGTRRQRSRAAFIRRLGGA